MITEEEGGRIVRETVKGFEMGKKKLLGIFSMEY